MASLLPGSERCLWLQRPSSCSRAEGQCPVSDVTFRGKNHRPGSWSLLTSGREAEETGRAEGQLGPTQGSSSRGDTPQEASGLQGCRAPPLVLGHGGPRQRPCLTF